MSNEAQPVRAVISAPQARPNRTYAQGRVCAQLGCESGLSIYNPSSMCWLHQSPRVYIVRGKRRRRGGVERSIA